MTSYFPSHYLIITSAFIRGLSKEHQYWTGEAKELIVSKFSSTFSAYLTVEHELEGLYRLGVEGVDTGPFGNCPICCTGPECERNSTR